jgi:membrane-associated protease RseP (regulator of RpoE activity)
MAGAMQQGVNPFTEPWRLGMGFPFAMTLMTILLSHELGHYFASRFHHTEATLPYFIPMPLSPIGTFGAFIKMKSPIITRRALVDIGASGPIIGFVFSVVASIAGLAMSETVELRTLEDGAWKLGDSLLFKSLAYITLGPLPAGVDIVLHPVAFAGWLGLFVTSLNLIPIGQLDGGHILFALTGRLHRKVSLVLVWILGITGGAGFLVASGWVELPETISGLCWPGWAIWAVLMTILGINHPPVMYWERPLDPRRRFIGWISLVIFVLTFTPLPFSV